MGLSKRLKKFYGHNCALPPAEYGAEEEYDRALGESAFTRFMYRLRKNILVCETNLPSSKYWRSEYALILERNMHFKTNPNIIHPLSNFSKYWKFFMIFVSFYQLFVTPFTTTFSMLSCVSQIHRWQDTPRLAVDIFCMLDIVIQFFTGFYDQRRRLNLNRADIAKHYLRGQFAFDLLSSLPPLYLTRNITVYANDPGPFYFNLFFAFCKIFRIVGCLKYMSKFAQMQNTRDFHTKLFMIIVTVMCVFHWVSCISICVCTVSISLSFYSFPMKQSWMTHDNVWNTTTFLVYSKALFRTSLMLSHAAFPIHEDSVPDKLMACSFWIMATVAFTATVSMLVQITRSFTSSQAKYKEMLLQLQQYMHHKQLSRTTQNRLISYYEFRYQKSFFCEQEILQTISTQLRQEILMLKCLKLVENVPFFKSLPQSLLMRIVMSLQLEIFLINDVILKAKTRGSSMYFIGSGTVATYTETGKEIYHLHDGQHFGEIELVMAESIRISTVVAIEPCELYRLDRKDFMQIIRPYPDLFQSIEQIAAERLQYILAIDEKYKHFYDKKRRKRLYQSDSAE